MRPDGSIADLALQFRASDEGRDRINDNDVERVRADECFANAQRFLAGARLGNEQLTKIDTELSRILRVKRMFDVDKRRQTASLLRLRDYREG